MLGAHVSFAAAKIHNEYELPLVQIFNGSPQSSSISELDYFERKEKIYIHGHYIYNLCNPKLAGHGLHCIKQELLVADRIKAEGVVIHMGKNVEHMDEPLNYMIEKILTLKEFPYYNKLIMENSSGAGTEVGFRYDELNKIKELTDCNFCFDTCHIWAAGEEDFSDIDAVFSKFKKFEPKLVHLNGSKSKFGTRKDVHAVALSAEDCLWRRANLVEFVHGCRRRGIDMIIENKADPPIELIRMLSE